LNQPEKVATTAFSQPAILVTTLATLEKARSAEPGAAAPGVNIEGVTHAAGFSLGEYSALIFSGAFSFEDGVRLIKQRAEGMQVAANETTGSMITVVGLTDEKVKSLCTDAIAACNDGATAKTIQVANYLFPQGRVLSGHKELCRWVAENAIKPKYGAMVANELPVAGAFHSSYMAPARDGLHAVLDDMVINMPRIPVYSNVTGRPYGSIEEIRDLLVKQLESPVHWEQTIKGMISQDHVGAFIDAGPGSQLKTMMRRIDKKAFSKTAVLDR
jgi:[acyl-carrier-protein] S-malonyltransferase